jgi:Chemoreceptor zinc-binding domain
MDQFNVAEAIQRIQKAKSSHIKWRSYAQGLVAGLPVSDDKAPVRHTDCEFGKWYHGDGAKLLGHLPVYQDIGGPHEVLHATYGQLFDFAKKGKHAKVQEQMGHLVAISRSLLEMLDILEQQVRSSS